MLPPRPMLPWHSHRPSFCLKPVFNRVERALTDKEKEEYKKKYGKDADSSVRHTSYAPVMIEMSLERGVLTPTTDKDGKPTTEIRNFTTSFNLPLLTIITGQLSGSKQCGHFF